MGSSESSVFFLFWVAFGSLGCSVFWVILFSGFPFFFPFFVVFFFFFLHAGW